MDPVTDDSLVERLVRAQHPRLAGPLRLVEHGWDNDIYRLGDELSVRLPRRVEAAELVVNEQRWLPTIARMLPLPIPDPVAIGLPGEGFPWHWSICRWLPGEPAWRVDAASRTSFAAELADALTALHRPAPADFPVNPVRGVPLAAREETVRARLVAFPELLPTWERALEAPAYDGPPLWLHGDLHPANVLTADGRLTAIIDFGDLTAGDPATDLAAAWLFFDPEGRAQFVDRTGADAATWLRARGWAAAMAAAFISGSPDGSPMIPLGHHAIAQLLTAE
jgi:aminoglycoside phosphotransferase (APT) family kinase protein